MWKYFNGQDWAANGPKMVTRTMKDFCSTKKVDSMNEKNCQGIKVLNPEAFYPIPWEKWETYFKNGTFNFKKSYSAHLWGALSSKRPLDTLEPQQLLYKLAMVHCPYTMDLIKSRKIKSNLSVTPYGPT